MEQTADQITHDIRSKRDVLRSNFEELEGKVKSLTDWRRHFEKHTGARTELLAKWASVKSALVGVAATRITGYLNQIVPGFHEELQKTETRRLQGPDTRLGAPTGRSN